MQSIPPYMTPNEQFATAIDNSDATLQPWKHWEFLGALDDQLIEDIHTTCDPVIWPEKGDANRRNFGEEYDPDAKLYDNGIFITYWGNKKEGLPDTHYKSFRLCFKKGMDGISPAIKQAVKLFTSKEVVTAFEKKTKRPIGEAMLKLSYVKEREGWGMYVHDDHPDTCALTVIIYIPKITPPEDNTMGTSVYNQNAELHHRSKYGHNVGFYFVPCNKKFRRTLHGFDGDIIGERYFLIAQYIKDKNMNYDDPRVIIKLDGLKSGLGDYYHDDTPDTKNNLWKLND